MFVFTTGIAPNNSLILLFWSTDNLPDCEGHNVARLVLSYLKEIESINEEIRDLRLNTTKITDEQSSVPGVPLEEEKKQEQEQEQEQRVKCEEEQEIHRSEDLTYLNIEVVGPPDIDYDDCRGKDQESLEVLITEEERQEVEEQRRNIENLEIKMDSEEVSGESYDGDESHLLLDEVSEEELVPTVITPQKTPSKAHPTADLDYVDGVDGVSTPLSQSRSPSNSIFSNYEWNLSQEDSFPTGNFTFSFKDLNVEILAKLRDSKRVKEKAELYEQLISTEKEAMQLSDRKYIRAMRMHVSPDSHHVFLRSPSPRKENKLNISAIYLEQINENGEVSPSSRDNENTLRGGKRRLSENRFLLSDQKARKYHQKTKTPRTDEQFYSFSVKYQKQ